MSVYIPNKNLVSFPAGYDRETIELAAFRYKLEFILMGAFSNQFESVWFQHTPTGELLFSGLKNDKQYPYRFNVDEFEDFYKRNMIWHAFDNIIGQWAREDMQQIVLEK